MGVLIDDKLKFHAHTVSVTAKAYRILAIIHKSFHFTDNQSTDQSRWVDEISQLPSQLAIGICENKVANLMYIYS